MIAYFYCGDQYYVVHCAFSKHFSHMNGLYNDFPKSKLQGVKEMLTFFSKTFTKRTEPGQRQSIEHESYVVHCYVRSDGLAGTVTTDLEYPARVAFVLLFYVHEGLALTV